MVNFVLPIRIAQVILALLVLGTAGYGRRFLNCIRPGIALLTASCLKSPTRTPAHPPRSTS